MIGWLVQLIAGLVLGLLGWLENRHEKSKNAKDADRHSAALRRIGERVRQWEDRADQRGLSGSDRTADDG